VDDDPAGLKKQKGKEYLKNLKKWCYEAGAPVGEEEEEDEEFGVGKVGSIAGVGHVANTKAKLKGVAMFKRLGKSGRAAAEAAGTAETVITRDQIKQENEAAMVWPGRDCFPARRRLRPRLRSPSLSPSPSPVPPVTVAL